MTGYFTYQFDQHFSDKLFNSKYEHRVSAWRELRHNSKTDKNFIQNVLNVYSHCPLTKTKTDFYKKNTWPTPWQLLEKNDYDFFDKCLAVMYTCKLTECFNQKKISIIKVVNKEQEAENNLKFNYIIQLESMFIDCHKKEIFDEKKFDKRYISQYTQET